jgi:hypothetical protein
MASPENRHYRIGPVARSGEADAGGDQGDPEIGAKAGEERGSEIEPPKTGNSVPEDPTPGDWRRQGS